MRAQPRLQRRERRRGDRDLALDVALAPDEQVVVRAVGARPADRADRQRAQLGVSQPAVAHQPQQRVVALADQRAAIRARACRLPYSTADKVSGGPTRCDGTRTSAASPSRPSCVSSARSIVICTRRVAGDAGPPPRPPRCSRHGCRRRSRRRSCRPTTGARPSSSRARRRIACRSQPYCLALDALAARAGDELADGVEVGVSSCSPAATPATGARRACEQLDVGARSAGYLRSRPSWL